MTKIRVLIVEDSAVVRALLEHIIGRDSRLEVAGTAGSGEEALRILERVSPDVIAMDICLPGIDGLEVTRRIMSRKPVPIVVVAASVASQARNTATMEALRAGALTALEKPMGTTHADYAALAEQLCTQLVIMSQVRLVRQHLQRPRRGEPALGPIGHAPGTSAYEMLGIVCSTGGPAAVVQLLKGLGPDFPLPILLVQHMTASFVPAFAAWLAGVCPFSVVVARGGEIPAKHVVHIAPPDRHLSLEGVRLRVAPGEPAHGHRPSGNVLFYSMARSLGGRALGLLLTGMGEDGAAGLLDIREAAGYTIVEDESTAVVYGMPAAAVQLGGACEILPLPAIAPRVLELLSGGRD